MTKPRHDYTPKQVSKLLGCSLRLVQQMLKEGKIQAYRLGGTGHPRITPAELDRVRAEWGSEGAAMLIHTTKANIVIGNLDCIAHCEERIVNVRTEGAPEFTIHAGTRMTWAAFDLARAHAERKRQ